jgi:putative redox protein
MSVKISCEYLGDLRTRATHGPSGNQLLTDAPVDNQGKGEAFSPSDLAATAVASCILTILGIQAKSLAADFRGARVEVEKHMTTVPPRRIARLDIRITMPAGIPEDTRARLIRAAEACPVKQSLHPDIVIAMTWSWGE